MTRYGVFLKKEIAKLSSMQHLQKRDKPKTQNPTPQNSLNLRLKVWAPHMGPEAFPGILGTLQGKYSVYN